MEVREQLGGDKEILGAVWLAGSFNQRIVNSTFGAHIHTLKEMMKNRTEKQKAEHT
jgi:hypothetical protein